MFYKNIIDKEIFYDIIILYSEYFYYASNYILNLET